ncbi:septum formation initiator family protein [Mycobacterium sp. MYCO198283]|uniref:FtsB family cell division protein n=1 Tax=Mycobacterium sp. MYCO198283 TaxID=2883505 RepID=UPI001E4D3F11|nr:septum formation initiator family protein [Mycobacterium sp. MYCO198283]MCG5430928.1 septum formation initiator family protein [Mycobacterium sp. MYCO198283]
MPEGKRSDPRRRSPASRPARPANTGRDRPRSPARRDDKPRASDESGTESPSLTESIATSIRNQVERQAEQRFGSTARRAAILAAVVCVLTLTIASPVRTYFAQRAEMQQLKASEATLREQIRDLEEQRDKLKDPVYIAAQARERLGFVMPGEIPYEVQLPPPPPGAVPPPEDPLQRKAPAGEAWYTSLWKTIADTPQNVDPVVPPLIPPAAPAPAPGG